jgi:hypothetical protein
MTAATPSAHRFRPGLKAMANGAGMLVLVLAVAVFPLSALAHQSVASNARPVVIFLPIAGVGLVIARRLPRNPIGWLLLACAAGILLNACAGRYVWLVYRLGHRLPLGPLALVLDLSWLAVYLTLPLVMLLFPDGTLPSRRWRPVLWAYLAVTLCLVLSVYVVLMITLASGTVRIDAGGGLGALENPSGNTAWISTVTTVVFLMLPAFWLAFVGRLVLSWRRSGGERRQQLKWLLSGVAAGLASGLIGIFTDNFDPHAPAAVQAIASSLNDAGVVVFAVCVGVAILKYRLYDIDRIISRTLAYAIVTGLLAGLYAGLVLLTTQVFRVHTPVAVAAATLAAAALFSPLRRRVQHRVDRRFNRARYDADQTVAAFAARLKDAVDLDAVRADLASVATKALEPAHVSVWISEPGEAGLNRHHAKPPSDPSNEVRL